MSENIIEALTGALTGIPELPSAACKGRANLFDLDSTADEDAVDRATAICLGCHELWACRRWLCSLPESERPAGVVAGRLLTPTPESSPREPRPSHGTPRRRQPRQPRESLTPVVAAWLAERLAAGPVPSADLKFEAGKRFGIAQIKHGGGVIGTAAHKVVGVEVRRVGRCSYWSLPGCMPIGPLDDEIAQTAVEPA